MGRFVDLDKPLSQEDRDYLKSRGRGYLIPANERRFGTPDEPREPEEHEAAGAPSQSPFYDTQERDRAVYDRGGAALPGTILDKDTGRAFDRDNGVLVEPPGFGMPLPGSNAYGSSADENYLDENREDGDIDEDIAERVTTLNTKDLESECNERGVTVPEVEDVSGLDVASLKERLNDEEVQYDPSAKKADLHRKLVTTLNRRRKEQLQDKLAISLQDERDGKG